MDLPAEHALKFIVTRYAGLLARHGEALRDPELVQPTAEHFPDDFHGDLASIGRMLERLATYAPLADDLPLALRVVEPAADDEAAAGGGCSSGACGSGGPGVRPRDGVVELDEGGFLVELNLGDVRHPVLLATALARGVGAIVLAEAEEDATREDVGALSEIAAVACGLGVLLHAGSYVYGKSCGGARVHSGTVLSVEEIAVALALFARVNGIEPRVVREHLETTQREALDLAFEWAASNDELVEGLRTHPDAIEAGAFALQPVRGLFGRLFKRRAAPALSTAAAEAAARAAKASKRTPEEQKKLDETRALVEEALSE